MSNTYSIYDASGEIIQVYELAPGDVPTVSDYPAGGGYLAGSYDPELWHVTGVGSTPTATLRASLNVEAEYVIQADGVDSVIIPIPAGTVVTDEETGSQYTAAAAENLTIRSTNRSGVFEFTIEPPSPYLSKTIVVTAHAD